MDPDVHRGVFSATAKDNDPHVNLIYVELQAMTPNYTCIQNQDIN